LYNLQTRHTLAAAYFRYRQLTNQFSMKLRLLKHIFLLLCLITADAAFAQRVMTGKITDALDGSALPGATIQVKGTSRGATTDVTGAYSVSVPNGATMLIVRYTGFDTKEVSLGAGTTLDVSLSSNSALATEDVVVLGSRSASRTKMTTAVPVDVIPVQNIVNEVGQVDLNQILTYVAPSFQSARQSISDGTDHVDPAQIRGLGPDQILVLVNGKRRHQSALVNVNGTVNRGTVGTDLSAIPATSIERVEILRDGAAAQYGSDAIAGVINIVLKKSTGVLGGNVSTGQYITEYAKNQGLFNLGKATSPAKTISDGQTIQAGLNYGFKLGSKGFLNLTGEYTSRGATNRGGTYTGTIYSAADDSILAAKNLTREDFDMRIGSSKVYGGAVTANLDYSINDNWNLYAFGTCGNKLGNAAGFYRYPSTIVTNARVYAPKVLALYPNGFLPEINSDVTDISFAAGAKGSLGKWNMDISNTFGQNTFNFSVGNSVNFTQAFLNPAALQTKFDAGGVKFLQNTTNLDLSRTLPIMKGLGLGFGAEHRIDLFGITAGEESSYKNYDTASGAAAGAQVFGGFLPTNEGNESRNCIGVYGDAELDVTDKFLVGTAVRFENYSDFGSTVNGKLVTRYRITDGITLRGSASTGFRAPSMQQRFYAKTNTLFVPVNGNLVPIESGTFTNDSKPAEILGIPKLKQETSVNYSAGFTTRLAKGLELTVDGYMIDITDRIVLTNNFTDGGDSIIKAQLAVANAGQANFFTNAVDTRSRGLEAVLVYGTKIGTNQDIRFTLAGAFIKNEVKKGADGKPIIKASDELVRTGQIARYFNREDQSRIEVASPAHKVSGTINYNVGKLGVMFRGVHFGKVTYLDPSIDPTKPDNFPANAFAAGVKQTLDQTFAAKAVFDLSLSYKILKGVGFTLGANNLFDTYQDIHTHSGNMSSGRFVYSRRVQQFGFNGRYVFGRISVDLK
jgi:iron complex outermembrane recepter protein